MTKINIPPPLRPYTNSQTWVEVQATNVAGALSQLITQHPDLGRRIFADDGSIRAFVNVYINDEDIRYLQHEDTQVNDGDTLYIVPSVAGGTL